MTEQIYSTIDNASAKFRASFNTALLGSFELCIIDSFERGLTSFGKITISAEKSEERVSQTIQESKKIKYLTESVLHTLASNAECDYI